MIGGTVGSKYGTEWSYKANWWISYHRWAYWRRKGMTPKQINRKFKNETT